jgi:glycosyltransferase involved in cell wall biosynthesis
MPIPVSAAGIADRKNYMRDLSPARQLDVSVILPVFKNRETLLDLHRRICGVLESRKLSFEIIFVDDDCPENSLAVLKELTRADERVAVLALACNVGQNQAILIGLRHARGNKAVVMDSDLQDPPELAVDMLDKLEDGYAVVFGGRRGQYQRPARAVTSRLYKILLHLVSGLPVDACLFFAADRSCVEYLAAFDVPKPAIMAFLAVSGMRTTSIPFLRARRRGGRSAYGFRMRFQAGTRTLYLVLRGRLYPPKPAGTRSSLPAVLKGAFGARFSAPEKNS